MALIPDDKISEIRDALDIVQVIGEHVQLKRAGVNWKGLCPFHSERSPSFNVHPPKQIFYCFGCHEKGDVFSFFMKLENKGFMEVARELAKRAGIELPERERSPEELAAEREHERWIKVNELAADFYRAQLTEGPRGQAAREYLEKRGIDEDTARAFRLGFAPDSWDALAQHLHDKKVPPQYAAGVGLIAPRERGGGYYDKFRGRLMCPIFNQHGEVVAFSGRIIAADAPKESPKYLNSGESPVFTKGRILFGMHQAREAWGRKRRAVLVEGNFDVITLHRCGLHEAVCPLGTALTDEQVAILKKRVEHVVLMLDGDAAGKKATLRSAEMLIKAGVPTFVALLPTGADPDDFARKNGAEAVKQRIDAGERAVKHFIQSLPRLVNLDPVEAVEHARTVVPLIQAIPDRSAQELAAHQVEAATGVPWAKVLGWAKQAEAQAPAQLEPAAPRAYSGEQRLVALIADHPQFRHKIVPAGLPAVLFDPAARAALRAAAESPSDKEAGARMLDASPTLAELILGGHFVGVEDPARAFEEAVTRLKHAKLKADHEKLKARARDAERAGDAEAARRLAQESLELDRNMRILLADFPSGQSGGEAPVSVSSERSSPTQIEGEPVR